MHHYKTFISTASISLLISNSTFAQDTRIQDELSISVQNMDLMWIIIAGALVFFMQAGFALLETGMARAKNAVNVMMKNYTDVCMASIFFWLIGYSLMFGDNSTGFFGFSGIGLSGDTPMDYASLFFQAMFAATAATICSGAMAERTKYNSYMFAAGLLIICIYPIYGSWVWNADGWLAKKGFIDFAGSTVVHSIGAWCALAGVIVVGPRLGRFDKETGEVRKIQGHNLTLVGIGGFILWLGWFGFNAGSTLEASSDIAAIALKTHLAATAGVLGVIFVFLIQKQAILMTSVVNGSLAGLVAITAGCASMSIEFSVLTGFIGGIICVLGNNWLLKLRIDDVVGAVSVHGFAGAWGTLAAGMFVTGDLFNIDQIIVQLIGIAAAFFWAFPLAYLMYFCIEKTVGLRSDALHEQRGLDITEHAEIGFPEFHQSSTYKAED